MGGFDLSINLDAARETAKESILRIYLLVFLALWIAEAPV
jgi:hypothetical protein